jgi:hypothetical protein
MSDLAQACVEILEQERATAQFIEERWDVLAEQSLREAGSMASPSAEAWLKPGL